MSLCFREAFEANLAGGLSDEAILAELIAHLEVRAMLVTVQTVPLRYGHTSHLATL